MKSKNILWLSLILGITGLIACSPEGQKLIIKPEVPLEKLEDKTNNLVRRPSVDILFVVDDSFSMSSHQNNLSNNIDLFVDEFSKIKVIDYHIGVISSSDNDPGDLRGYPKFIENSTLYGLDYLKKNIRLGTSGSGSEQMFDPVARALDPVLLAGYNKGFYRPESLLVVIFITDAEDQSEVYNANSFMDYLVKLKGSKDKVLSYGAIIPSDADTTKCQRDDIRKKPVEIETFLGLNINAGRNTVWLCDRQFGAKLVDFSKEIVRTVNKPIVLSKIPIVSSIKIKFGTQEILPDFDTGWFFDVKLNAIRFGENLIIDESQPKDTTLSITYNAAVLENK